MHLLQFDGNLQERWKWNDHYSDESPPAEGCPETRSATMQEEVKMRLFGASCCFRHWLFAVVQFDAIKQIHSNHKYGARDAVLCRASSNGLNEPLRLFACSYQLGM